MADKKTTEVEVTIFVQANVIVTADVDDEGNVEYTDARFAMTQPPLSKRDIYEHTKEEDLEYIDNVVRKKLGVKL